MPGVTRQTTMFGLPTIERELGLAASIGMYKKSIPGSLKRRTNTLAALFELADREFRQVRDETELQIKKASAEPEPEVQEPATGAKPAGATRAADEIVRSVMRSRHAAASMPLATNASSGTTAASPAIHTLLRPLFFAA
jgi:hypothetical protein